MSSVMKATPRVILGGIQDLSGRTPVAVPEQLPSHLPLIYLLTERGKTEPQVAIGTGFNQLFGSWSLDVRSEFCNHATMLARTIMKNANMCMIQRVLPPNARAAMLRLWVEVVPASIPIYQRDSAGNIEYDANNNPIIATTGGVPQEVVGHRLVWHASLDPMGSAAVVTASTNQALTGSGSTVTIDGVVVAHGNRVELTGQTDANQNGLYKLVVTTVGMSTTWELTPAVQAYGQATARVGFREGDYINGSSVRLDGLVNRAAPTVVATADVALIGSTPLSVTTSGGPVALVHGDTVTLNGQTVTADNGDYILYVSGGSYTLVEFQQTPASLGDSTLYPVADFLVSSEGDFGNRVGLRLSAPNSQSLIPGDVSAMNNQRAYMFRLSCVEKPRNSSTPLTVETVAGEQFIDLTVKDDTIHPIYGTKISMGKSFTPAWELLNDPNVAPLYGPFGGLYLYRSNIDTVLGLLADGSVTLGTTGEGYFDSVAGRDADLVFANRPDNRHLLNMFTGVDQYGIPYYSMDVASSVDFGGVAFGDTTVLYATRGNDGLIKDVYGKPDKLANLRMFDGLVQDQLANFGNLDIKLLDDARYPLSTFWDSGFSLNTKKAALTMIGKRKDVWVALSTQAIAEYADPQDPQPNEWSWQDINTATEETSIGRILSDAALLYPESEIYGTKCCRAIVVRHADNQLLGSEYDGILPFTLDLADKVSLYCGAANGKWNSNASFTESPNNQVRLFAKANVPWRSNSNYDNDWDAGLIWAQFYNRRTLFFPAYQTVYPDDTSVLNSLPTMMACVELEKIAQRTWRDIAGDDKLTKEQVVAKSDRLIAERARDRFDGRFVIQPETYYTPADTQRGFSYSCKVHIYANNAPTVAQVTIVAHRMDDLEGEAL